MIVYREGMSEEELKAFMAELEAEDQAWAQAEAYDAEHYEEPPEDWEDDDPVRNGWVGSDGRP